MSVRVAFKYEDARVWRGGYNYLLNLVTALLDYGTAQPVVFYGVDAPEQHLEPFREALGADLVQSDVFAPERLAKGRTIALATGSDRDAAAAFAAARIDIVFEHADFYGLRFNLPTISWIGDFQHRHLPLLFTRAQKLKREARYRLQTRGHRQVMVSSDDARRDLQAIYNPRPERVHVVPFAVPFRGLTAPDRIAEARSCYDLPLNYFFLPNQFWKHKNHTLVVQALQLLKEKGESVVVAVSGASKSDETAPIVQEVERQLDTFDLANEFRMLGEIPYDHVIALLAGATALINPSHFEGWSTTVEEAKSNGVPMVLSNLGVHREQTAGLDVTFFDPDNHRELAEALRARMANVDRSCRPDATQLAEASAQRMNNFVASFEKLLSVAQASTS